MGSLNTLRANLLLLDYYFVKYYQKLHLEVQHMIPNYKLKGVAYEKKEKRKL